MGSWQERIRQRLSAEQQQVKAQQDAERLRAQQEKERQLEIIRQGQEKIEAVEIQLLPILEKLGARDLLQQVEREVWKVGEIQQVENNKASIYVPQYVGYELRYAYDVAKRWAKYYDAGVSSQTGTHVGGITAQGNKIEPKGGLTSLRILVFRGNTNENNYVTVKDSTGSPGRHSSLSLIDRYHYPQYKIYRIGDFDGVDVSDANAQQFIQDMVFESSLQRTRHHSLPLELKVEAEREIARSVPWHKRMLR